MASVKSLRSRKINAVQAIQGNVTENDVIQLAAYSVVEQSNVALASGQLYQSQQFRKVLSLLVQVMTWR
jgi:hypothetical protein